MGRREDLLETLKWKGRKRSLYQQVFQTPAGEAVLLDLWRQCGANRLSFAIHSPDFVAFQEGQRSIWLYLEKCLHVSDKDIALQESPMAED